MQYIQCAALLQPQIHWGPSGGGNKYRSTFADVALCQLLIWSQMPNLEAIRAFNDAAAACYCYSVTFRPDSHTAWTQFPWVRSCMEKGKCWAWWKIYWEHLFVWDSITMAGNCWGERVPPSIRRPAPILMHRLHPFAFPASKSSHLNEGRLLDSTGSAAVLFQLHVRATSSSAERIFTWILLRHIVVWIVWCINPPRSDTWPPLHIASSTWRQKTESDPCMRISFWRPTTVTQPRNPSTSNRCSQMTVRG